MNMRWNFGSVAAISGSESALNFKNYLFSTSKLSGTCD